MAERKPKETPDPETLRTELTKAMDRTVRKYGLFVVASSIDGNPQRRGSITYGCDLESFGNED